MTNDNDPLWVRHESNYPETDGQLTCTFNLGCGHSHEAYAVRRSTDKVYRGEAACRACLTRLELEP